MCAGRVLHYSAGDGETDAPQPSWPTVQTVLVSLLFSKSEAAEPAAWAVLQHTGCSPGRNLRLSDLVKGMSQLSNGVSCSFSTRGSQ